MQRLTEGLLEVSRLDHGFSGERVLTDLRVLVLDTISGGAHRDHVIDVDGEASALVDPERFRQVVQNLVDNAVKFSPGQRPIRVELATTDAGARLSVIDSGVGLLQDEVDAIFDRFQRGSAARSGLMGGMGVGLYLCRRIVEEHGGTIRAERRPEGGSRFVVDLPATEPAEVPRMSAPIAPEPLDHEPSLGERAAARFVPSR